MTESYEDPTAEFQRELLKAAMGDGYLEEEEARTLIRSVVSPTKERMPDALAAVITWAHETKLRSAILDVILKMNGALEVTPDADNEAGIAMRFRPDITIEVDPDLW